VQNNEIGHYYKKIEKNIRSETKILGKNININANLAILPNKLIIAQVIDPVVCIVIENKSIVEMQRQQFNIIWDSIK
jgi:hypothetical protein